MENDLLDGMIAAAHEVGDLILSRPRTAPATTFAEFRRNFDAVQDPAEAVLRKRLDALLPGVEWADEFDPDLPAGARRWVADVADGAVQYMQGLPQWCASVTLVEDRTAVAAVLHNPVQGETYSARAGRGAHLNGRPISPSAKSELPIALVATSQPPFIANQPHAVSEAGCSLSAVLPAVGAVRNLGPTSWQVADVASGRIDAFWEYGRDTGNLLGAQLIAREAGAIVTEANGNPWHPASTSFLAAPTHLHTQLRALLNQQPTTNR
jgi:myo-inositol-1(or 4)-monophosphatase